MNPIRHRARRRLLFDAKQGVTKGQIPFALIPPEINDDLSIEKNAQTSAEWSVNGRFFGFVDIPDLVVRQVPNITVQIARSNKPSTSSAMLPWAGQEPFACTTTWDKGEVFVASRLVPFPIPPTSAYQIVAGYLVLYADLKELEVRLQPPGGEPVTAHVDLDCQSGPGGVCIG